MKKTIDRELMISPEIFTETEIDVLYGTMRDRLNDYELLPSMVKYELCRRIGDDKQAEFYKFRIMGMLGV